MSTLTMERIAWFVTVFFTASVALIIAHELVQEWRIEAERRRRKREIDRTGGSRL